MTSSISQSGVPARTQTNTCTQLARALGVLTPVVIFGAHLLKRGEAVSGVLSLAAHIIGAWTLSFGVKMLFAPAHREDNVNA